jgi:hypothetical protein
MAASPSLFLATFLVDQARTRKARSARSRTSTNLLIHGLVIVGGAPRRCALAGSGEYAHLGRAVGRHCRAYRRGVVVRGQSRSRDHRDEAWLEALVQLGTAGLDALVATSVVGSARPVGSDRSVIRAARPRRSVVSGFPGVPAVADLTKPSASGGLHA